jgi:hypothetical protein
MTIQSWLDQFENLFKPSYWRQVSLEEGSLEEWGQIPWWKKILKHELIRSFSELIDTWVMYWLVWMAYGLLLVLVLVGDWLVILLGLILFVIHLVWSWLYEGEWHVLLGKFLVSKSYFRLHALVLSVLLMYMLVSSMKLLPSLVTDDALNVIVRGMAGLTGGFALMMMFVFLPLVILGVWYAVVLKPKLDVYVGSWSVILNLLVVVLCLVIAWFVFTAAEWVFGKLEEQVAIVGYVVMGYLPLTVVRMLFGFGETRRRGRKERKTESGEQVGRVG